MKSIPRSSKQPFFLYRDANPALNVYINIFNQEDIVCISIRDEGPGLNEMDKELAFKKFAKLSAKPTAGETSSGLGLSIVKLLTEAMGGKVKFNPEIKSGAEFIVQFPSKAL